jgi:tRNA(Ile)-lysidine synthase
LIPIIKEVFPKVEDNIINNMVRFQDIEILYEQSILLHKKKLLEKKGEEFHVPILKLLQSEPQVTIVYEVIKAFGFTANQTDEVIKLLTSESGKYIQSLTHRVFKNRKWLIIAPLNNVIAENILIETANCIVNFKNGKLKFEKFSPDDLLLANDNSIAQLSADDIFYPLLLRKWKQGDYFYPLGMNKKKKLSRFLIDQKLSLTEKENIWVVEMNKKIIWVVGKRIDDRFKITPKTKTILKISLD